MHSHYWQSAVLLKWRSCLDRVGRRQHIWLPLTNCELTGQLAALWAHHHDQQSLGHVLWGAGWLKPAHVWPDSTARLHYHMPLFQVISRKVQACGAWVKTAIKLKSIRWSAAVRVWTPTDEYLCCSILWLKSHPVHWSNLAQQTVLHGTNKLTPAIKSQHETLWDPILTQYNASKPGWLSFVVLSFRKQWEKCFLKQFD